MILAPTRHECVIVFVKCFCPISLCFILCRLDILKWKAFLIKPTVCSILMIDVTIDERNKLLTRSMLRFHFCTVPCCLKRSSSEIKHNFDLFLSDAVGNSA